MEETKKIELSLIEAQEFNGVRNENINRIKEKFPQLLITMRGSVIKLTGSTKEIGRFEGCFNDLQAYYNKYGHLSPGVIDQIFDTISTLPKPRTDKSLAGKKSQSKEVAEPTSDDKSVILYGAIGNVVRARTANQAKMVKSYSTNDLLFVVGPAGSGKTYTAIALAVRALKNREVKKIILTRPAVEAGEKLGFLPGDMKEKLDPYLQPLYDALHDMIPQKKLLEYIGEGVVQIAPLAYMRGRTLDNAFVILDEAQNTTLSQIKMFLTRMGTSAKFIVTGDATQIDLPHRADSGLLKAISMLQGIKGISVIEMTGEDIVRHQLVKDIVKAFDKASEAQKK